jgi:hypothetical protein
MDVGKDSGKKPNGTMGSGGNPEKIARAASGYFGADLMSGI